MPRPRRLATILVTLALAAAAGCGPMLSDRGRWVRPGVDSDTMRRDLYDCEREAVLGRGRDVSAETLFDRCMRARGYVRPNEPAGAVRSP